MTDDATDNDFWIAFGRAGEALCELFFGLRRDVIPCDVDVEIGMVHPRVNGDQFRLATRRLVESNSSRQLRSRRPVDADDDGRNGSVIPQSNVIVITATGQ